MNFEDRKIGQNSRILVLVSFGVRIKTPSALRRQSSVFEDHDELAVIKNGLLSNQKPVEIDNASS